MQRGRLGFDLACGQRIAHPEASQNLLNLLFTQRGRSIRETRSQAGVQCVTSHVPIKLARLDVHGGTHIFLTDRSFEGFWSKKVITHNNTAY
jgi:hypothetical protein